VLGGTAVTLYIVLLIVNPDMVVCDRLPRHSVPASHSHGFVVLVRVKELTRVHHDQTRNLVYVLDRSTVIEEVAQGVLATLCASYTCTSDQLFCEVDSRSTVETKLSLQLSVCEDTKILEGIINDNNNALPALENI
jgi:hypothetical protein